MRFKELTGGKVITAGPYLVTTEEILSFARQYDPQWFHTDPARAANGRWQGLIASGWHTTGIAMRLIADAVLQGSESYGSPGVENLKWLQPVRAGDALSLRAEVLEARISNSGSTGILRWRWELWNQAEQQVFELIGTSLFDLRQSAGGSAG